VHAPEVDVTALMRVGHPQIADGDEYILQRVDAWCARHGRAPRIFNVGCGSGWLARRLVDRVPRAEVLANEIDPTLLGQLRRRLEGTRARVVSTPFEEWREPVDILISWGSHHHLPRSYMDHARALLGEDAVFVLGDEFCPEYTDAADRARISAATVLEVVDGLVFTSAAEIEAYRQTGVAPESAQAMERRRRIALWRWYRYVVDYAVARDCFDVAIYELQSAHDDLITAFGDEHKMAPSIVERDMDLRGYRCLSRRSLGPVDEPDHQSFVVYEFAR
jgi:SAM-dependent methyltransferase